MVIAFAIISGFSFMNKEEFCMQKRAEQLKHQLYEGQARNRVKARKARTRRLIVEGAMLESVFPEVKRMSPDEIRDFLNTKRTENMRLW